MTDLLVELKLLINLENAKVYKAEQMSLYPKDMVFTSEIGVRY
jgi:hypothetical protein